MTLRIWLRPLEARADLYQSGQGIDAVERRADGKNTPVRATALRDSRWAVVEPNQW